MTPPLILNWTSEYTAVVGQTVRCAVVTGHTLTVSWLWGRGQVDPASVIDSVQHEHGGRYTCDTQTTDLTVIGESCVCVRVCVYVCVCVCELGQTLICRSTSTSITMATRTVSHTVSPWLHLYSRDHTNQYSSATQCLSADSTETPVDN